MSAPKYDSNDGIWKAMTIVSFLMLSMLTWGMSPLQKLVEKVQHKETVKAKVKVCRQMLAMLPVYEQWTGRLFTNGCLWQGRGFAIALYPEREKELRKQWEDQEGKEFDMVNHNCMEGAAAQQRENNIRDKVLSPLYHENLDCPAVYEEAEKLGIKEDEDVQ